MSTSSNEFLPKAEKEQDSMPEWLDRFLGKTFFDKCLAHDLLQKNDLNRYCITCDASICKFCITFDDHKDHELLTIYRHVYQDVVPLNEMERHMNCAEIQPYKCNKKWVVSLTPLPHNGSGLLIEGNGACTICRRKLTDPDRFRLCSIACKLEAVTRRRIVSTFHGAGGSSRKRDDEEVEHVEVEQVEPQRPRKRSRKGVPHRAPLF